MSDRRGTEGELDTGGVERQSARGRWRLPALRLRHKLAISLSIAALLPVVVAAWVSVSTVLRGLERGLRDQTDRQLAVGMNLVLRQVERLGDDAVRLASEPGLAGAIERGPAAVQRAIERASPHLPAALVQLADARGDVVLSEVLGGDATRFAGVSIPDRGPSIAAGLAYERRVTIVGAEGRLIIRAVAPIVDEAFVLRGVVVLSLPMDGDFADGIKGALGTDVMFFARDGAASSTFLDAVGSRVGDIALPATVAERVLTGHRAFARDAVAGREFTVGYAPLKNLDGNFVGAFAAAVNRAPLAQARTAALRSLALGAAGAFVFALGLAGLLSRRLTQPIAILHQGAIAIARGDLDHRIRISEGDEIGDLASAFTHMTKALKTNQSRLAARMRELVALHDAGRAVSSVLSLDQVLRKLIDSVARVMDVRTSALWLVDDGGEAVALRMGAARVRRAGDLRETLSGRDAAKQVAPLEVIAEEVALARATLRVDHIADDVHRREAAVAAGVTGSLIAVPLERKGVVVGVMVVGRSRDARPFNQADANLLATFADQGATAIENARLYEEVRAFNEELEQKVALRTAELTTMNDELGRALRELRETQAQLILSERLAGLGQLVAGVAHEINSPSAAIRGSIDSLAENVRRLTEASVAVASMPATREQRALFLHLVADEAPKLARSRVDSPVAVRRAAREVRARLEEQGVTEADARDAASALAEIGAADLAPRLYPLLPSVDPMVPVAFLKEHVYLQRNAETIAKAIARVQQIVRVLKSYSHLDQQASLVPTDIHEGIEDTLLLLQHELGRGIRVSRKYGKLPPVAVFVDELNQVWTNLVHNAVQALGGEGAIEIETETVGEGVAVRVIDDGPGIADDVMPRIFEPFFTTKAKGEGTGLGLGIVRNIVDKHGGHVRASSQPGRTCFEVWLPLDGGAERRKAG